MLRWIRAACLRRVRRLKDKMENRTKPRTVGQWLRYLGMALIALWLIVWLLRMSGVNII